MSVRVAIVGDSAMWGQGLTRAHTYAHLAAAAIAAELGETPEVVPGRSPLEPERGESRSGAKLRPAASATPGADTDATRFIDKFPRLFGSETERLDFLFARDEGAAARLFGEHPATFPTVTDGVRALAATKGAAVDLVLLDGGINDLDFEEVLNPEGAGLRTIERQIHAIFGDSLKQCLVETRRAFPRAVIVVVGYFSALSDRSSRAKLEQLFKYLAGKPEWQVTLNDLVQYVPVLSDVLNTFLTKDVDALIEQAITRSEIAAAYAHFWTRQTISTLPARTAGPGIVYAHPGFTADHALFAGARTLLYEGYRQPGEGGPEVGDEMLARRRRNTPRLSLLDDYKRLTSQLLPLVLASGRLDRPARTEIRNLLRERDLPTSLRDAAEDVLDGADVGKLTKLLRSLSSEIGRIEVTTIASFLHPNPAGARRIAERIHRAYVERLRFSVRSMVRAGRPAAEGVTGLRQWLRDRGFEPSRGVRRLASFAHVESFALQFEGLAAGVHPVTLRVGRETFDLLATRSSSKRFFQAFDTQQELGTVSPITLSPRRLGPIGGSVPGFERVALFVNGRQFHTRPRPARPPREGQSLTLWPPA
jgi:hypothetical protein